MTKEKKLKRSMSKKEAAKIRAELDEKKKKERTELICPFLFVLHLYDRHYPRPPPGKAEGR